MVVCHYVKETKKMQKKIRERGHHSWRAAVTVPMFFFMVPTAKEILFSRTFPGQNYYFPGQNFQGIAFISLLLAVWSIHFYFWLFCSNLKWIFFTSNIIFQGISWFCQIQGHFQHVENEFVIFQIFQGFQKPCFFIDVSSYDGMVMMFMKVSKIWYIYPWMEINKGVISKVRLV